MSLARISIILSAVTICGFSVLCASAQNPQSPEQFQGSNNPYPPKGCILGDYPEVSVACGDSRTVTRPVIATPEPGMPACPEESKVINGTCDCKYHCPSQNPACNETLTLNWIIDQLPTTRGAPCPQDPCAVKNGPPCPTPTHTPTATPTPLCGNKVIDPGEECDFAVPPACSQCSCNKDCKLDCPDTCVNNHKCSITDEGQVRLDVWWGPDVPAVGPGPLDLANVEPWPFMPSGTASLGCCPERFWGTHKVICKKGQKEVVFLGKSICPSAIGAFTGARIACPCPPPIDCVLGDWPPVTDLACGETLTIRRPIAVAAQNFGKECPEETKKVTRVCTPIPTATATATPTKTPTPVSPPSQPCTLSCPSGQTLNQLTCSCEPQCPPVDSNTCGKNCVPAPYPKCIECSGTCETTPITYYTADGQCLMATSWGPSESCCPKQGCDIKAHGYGDQQDESGIWYKMVDIVSACPSYPGMTGPPVKCPTCKCTDKVDCVRSDPNGDGLPYMLLDGLEPRYGHSVIRDENGVRIDQSGDQCWCVPKADACPAGYKPNSSSNPEIEYTRLENTGLLDGTTCKNPTSNQAP
jgi:hypothetical protein